MRDLLEFVAAHFGAIAVSMYVVIGFTVVAFIDSWSPFWITREHERAEDEDDLRRMLRFFFAAGSSSAIVMFVQVLLWPVWAVYIWSTKPARGNDADEDT